MFQRTIIQWLFILNIMINNTLELNADVGKCRVGDKMCEKMKCRYVSGGDLIICGLVINVYYLLIGLM